MEDKYKWQAIQNGNILLEEYSTHGNGIIESLIEYYKKNGLCISDSITIKKQEPFKIPCSAEVCIHNKKGLCSINPELNVNSVPPKAGCLSFEEINVSFLKRTYTEDDVRLSCPKCGKLLVIQSTRFGGIHYHIPGYSFFCCDTYLT